VLASAQPSAVASAAEVFGPAAAAAAAEREAVHYSGAHADLYLDEQYVVGLFQR
jgi:hypothetical protein